MLLYCCLVVLMACCCWVVLWCWCCFAVFVGSLLMWCRVVVRCVVLVCCYVVLLLWYGVANFCVNVLRLALLSLC